MSIWRAAWRVGIVWGIIMVVFALIGLFIWLVSVLFIAGYHVLGVATIIVVFYALTVLLIWYIHDE